MKTNRTAGWIALCVTCLAAGLAEPAAALQIVKDGKPVATVVVSEGVPEALVDKKTGTFRPLGRGHIKNIARRARKDPRAATIIAEAHAASVLLQWVQLMSGALLPVSTTAPEKGPAIYLGSQARAKGLKLDGIEARWGQACRVVCDGKNIMIDGDGRSPLLRGVGTFLEQLGCLYLFDDAYRSFLSPDFEIPHIGKSYPSLKTISVEKMDIGHAPKLLGVRSWGSDWQTDQVWNIWNGHGGYEINVSHAWHRHIGPERGKVWEREHPEWVALQTNGKREVRDGWVCTSNPEMVKEFIKNILDKTPETGPAWHSLSPPDNQSFCVCENCKKLDVPTNIEKHSGKVSMTDRYMVFYQQIAEAVAKKNPEVTLSFYAYSDYSRAPADTERKWSKNLMVFPAPIRYCRYHPIGDERCPYRGELKEIIDGWGASLGRMGYRTYQFNLSDVMMPYSKLSIWRHDVPYLYKNGLENVSIETWLSPAISAPSDFLGVRIFYDPELDADALLDNFYMKAYGDKAGPIMKEYWETLDEHVTGITESHAGSIFALHYIHSPENTAKLQAMLDKAKAAAKGDEKALRRIHMHDLGLANAKQYVRMRELFNSGKLAEAQQEAIDYKRRFDDEIKDWIHSKGHGYENRFLTRSVNWTASRITDFGGKLVAQLPDEWKLKWDDAKEGEKLGYYKANFDDSDWDTVKTYSTLLRDQGQDERLTYMWYRTTIDVPKKFNRLRLVFQEVDGIGAPLYVNGKKVAPRHMDLASMKAKVSGAWRKRNAEKVYDEPPIPQAPYSRRAFDYDITDYVKRGKPAQITLHVDHTYITELYLGGIIRPVFLVDMPKDFMSANPAADGKGPVSKAEFDAWEAKYLAWYEANAKGDASTK